MKKLLFLGFLPAFLLVACSKDKSVASAATAPNEEAKPLSGNFRMSTDNLFENQEVTLTPEDTRAGNAYYWDFGLIGNKRVTSTDAVPKLSIKWHGNYYVTLTVTDARGVKATTTQFMPVLCSWDGTGTHP